MIQVKIFIANQEFNNLIACKQSTQCFTSKLNVSVLVYGFDDIIIDVTITR